MKITDLYIGKRFEFGCIEWVVRSINQNDFGARALGEEFAYINFDVSFLDKLNWR